MLSERNQNFIFYLPTELLANLYFNGHVWYTKQNLKLLVFTMPKHFKIHQPSQKLRGWLLVSWTFGHPVLARILAKYEPVVALDSFILLGLLDNDNLVDAALAGGSDGAEVQDLGCNTKIQQNVATWVLIVIAARSIAWSLCHCQQLLPSSVSFHVMGLN